MGNLFSGDHVIDEQAVATYTELTYLRKSEIRHIATLLDEVDPGKLRGDLQHRFTLEQIDKIFPEIHCSPFRDSIYRVFSSKKDGHLSLEDVLDLCSAFSENSFENARAAWAFYIFDFDGDNQISLNDLIEAVQMLTRNEQTECGSIGRAEAEHVARMVGQKREYRIGTLLQKLYGKFMGDTYLHDDLRATSTDVDRTKVSLELVLTALYQEKRSEQCKHPKYLTIPMLYKPTIVDDVLMPFLCPLYIEELERVLNLTIVRKKISQYNDLYQVVSENTGFNATSYPLTSVSKVYQLVMSERSMKIATPKWITHRIFKQIEEVVMLGNEIGAYTTKLKRLFGGTLIKQFIQNMNLTEESTEKPKMYLYSAHDINIGAFSKAHGFKKPEIPLYGSTIIVEKLRDHAGSVFVRMMLWTGVTEELITYTIPGCGKICPINKYLNFVRDIIPTDEESNCLWNVVTKDELRQYYEYFD
ncbi:venom acid phosphatase Acph-1-like isoform X2 [Andrena cerasifolii]|uniref:venom acid phosphatase Acph-1-like isoform X2 n=1 Tax=Andrena cerasifolii TaxID=2819439 RepID=UPI0040376113